METSLSLVDSKIAVNEKNIFVILHMNRDYTKQA